MRRRVGEPLDPLSRSPDQRQRRDELRGDVGADLGGERRQVVDLAGSEAQDRRGVGAAAAQPGRDRDALLDLDPQRRVLPAARAQAGESAGGEVLAVDPGAEHLVALRLGDLDRVGEGERLEQGAELVQPVVAQAPQVEAEVELGGGVNEHRG